LQWQDAGALAGTSPQMGIPDIAVDRGGNAVAVWIQLIGSRYEIWSARFDVDAGHWSDAGSISPLDAGGANVPRVAVDWSGNAFAVWSESVGGGSNGRANRFDVALGRWGDAGIICPNNGSSITDTAVAADPSGNAIALFWRGQDIQWNRFDVDAGRWSDAGSLGNGFSMRLAVGASGIGVAAWDTGFSGSEVYARVWDPVTLSWAPAAKVSGSATPATTPTVAVDSAGNATAAWRQLGAGELIWANRYSADAGRWGDAGGIEPYDGGSAYNPQVAVDPFGAVTVVWQRDDGVRSNIWASRFEVGAALWSDAGTIEFESRDMDNPTIGVDEFGNVVAVWRAAGYYPYEVWSNRFVAMHGRWGDAGAIDRNLYDNSVNARVGVAPSGNAFAIWETTSSPHIEVNVLK
jgi:hypothetical protein